MSSVSWTLRVFGGALALWLTTAAVCPAQAPKRKPGTTASDSKVEAPETAEDAPAPEPETEPAPETKPEPPAEARPRSSGIFGDPESFTRLGGWGGIGGTMGQWGLGKSMLVMMPAVQKELAMTEEQIQELRAWLDQMRQRGEEMARSMQQQGGEDLRRADVPIAARILMITNLMSRVSALLKENEAGINRILDSDQRKRLTQIALQMEGVAALAKPEVARAVNLSPSQSLRIQQVLNQSRTSQLRSWLEPMFAMQDRGNSGRPGAAGGPRPPGPRGPATNDSSSDRAARRAEAERQFTAMRQNSDRIQEQTVAQVLKILTNRQRETFDRLLGEPFDPNQLTAPGAGGQRRDQTTPREPPRRDPEDDTDS